MRQIPIHVPPVAWALLALSLCAGSRVCFGGDTINRACPESGVRIYLDRHGKVTVNGKAVSVESLGGTLAAIQPRPTVICYARDAPQLEPPAQASVVMATMISLRLPIGIFTDNTFKTPVR
jgi:hypothetical protein